MKQLLLLEMKKHNFVQIMMGGGIASGVLLVYLLLSAMLLQPNDSDYVGFLSSILALNKMVFTLFASLVMVKMFSDEIHSKSISILFTYPLSRKRLLVVKIVLVLMLTMPLMLCSMLLHFIVWVMLNGLFGFVQGELNMALVGTYILASIIHSVLASLAALIPLIVDVKHVSSEKTLITSAIMSVFLYSFTGKSLFGMSLALGLLAAVLGIFLSKRAIELVSEMDIM